MSKMGVVYLLECVNTYNSSYKIGFTRGKVSQRIESLQTGNGFKISELHSFPTSFGQRLEKTVQRYYQHKKLKGEWYDLDKSDIDKFMEICQKTEDNFKALRDNPFFK